MATNGGSVRCAGAMLGQHRHICAFFNSFDEQHRVLRSFIKEGFERGDKAFHIVDPELWQDHLKRLVEAGIDVEQAMGSGQLELRRWQDAYLRDDRFDQDARVSCTKGGGDPAPADDAPRFLVSALLFSRLEWSLWHPARFGSVQEPEESAGR